MTLKPSRLCLRSVDFRAASETEEGDGRSLEGYAAVFDTPTEIDSWEGRFSETIARGAFKKTLRERMPVLQFDHGRDMRTGSVPIGAFTELKEDDKGLFVSARLFDNPVVEPIRQAIEGEAITGMSFRFEVTRDEWRDAQGKKVRDDELGDLLWMPGERGPLQRTIREVKLFEAGPVVFPAYEATSVGVRSTELTDEERAAIVADYARTAELPEPEGAAPDQGTPERSEETPDDAAPEGTSEGHENRSAPESPAAPITRQLPELPAEARKDSVPMRTVEEFRTRLGEIRSRMEEIDAESSGAALSEERQTEWDSLNTEFKSCTESIERIEARAQALKENVIANPTSVERGTDQGAPNFIRKQDDIYDVSELRAMSYSGEDFLNKVRDNAKRAVEKAKFARDINKEDAQTVAADLLDQVDTDDAALAKRFLITGSPVYERAFGKVLRYSSDAMCTVEERQALLRAQTLGTDAGGGYAVPFQLDPTVILTNAGVVNPIRQLARVEQIVGKEWQGVTSAGVSVSRGAEAAEAPDSSFTLGQPVLRTNRVQGFVPFSIEIELSWSALRSEITRLLIDAKATEEDSFITGNGSGTNPGGVVATLSGNTVTAGGTASFAAADVYNLEAALAPRWEPNASWLAHKAIYHRIRQFDTAGGAQFWASIGDGRPPRLLDYPDYRSSAMASTLTTGNKILMFGDFKQFLIVDRIGMNIELIPFLLGASGRPTGQRGVYAVWMNNSKILVDSAFKLLVTG